MNTLQTWLRINPRVVVVLLFAIAGVVMIRLTPNTGVAQSSKRSIKIEIPEHLPIKVRLNKNKEDAIKEMKNDKWLREFELEVENTGSKPIYFLSLTMILPETRNETGLQLMFPLVYGPTRLSKIENKADNVDVSIKPGETHRFRIVPTQIPAWEQSVKEGRAQPEKVDVVFQVLSFGDGTGFAGTDGTALPRPLKS